MTPDSVGGVTVAEKLRRSLRRLAIATAILYLALVLGGLKVYLANRQTTQTLCTLRDDLRNRVDASVAFLQEHPAGIPGVPTGVILKGIEDQRKTIIALNNLNCD